MGARPLAVHLERPAGRVAHYDLARDPLERHDTVRAPRAATAEDSDSSTSPDMAQTRSGRSRLPARSCALGLALGLALAACGGAHDARPRNLILISLDTLRPDHLGCYGNARETSPAIDRLAARGVRFADAVSAAPWTLPSHTTMFTGLYPSHHGVKDYTQRLPADKVTLAEVLAEHGFETFAVASTWNIARPSFQIFQGFAREHLRYVQETEVGASKEVEDVLDTGPQVVAAAKEFLAGRDPARPFFLFAHFYDAHSDFAPRPEYRARFVAPYSGDVDGTTRQLFRLRDRPERLAPADVQHLKELYDAEIRQLDDVVGGFLDDLERQGLLADTLVALVSDHGEEFQEHGGLLHGRTQYQELLRVPWILAGPGIPAARVVTEPVSLVDLCPTLLARFGLAPPGPVDGLDVSPALTASAPVLPARLFFSEADHNNVIDDQPVVDIKRSARLGHEKLVLDRHADRAELYDLAADPGEQHDLSAEAPDKVQALRALMTRFFDGAVNGEANGSQLSAQDHELLRAIGYMGDDEASGEQPAAPSGKKEEGAQKEPR